MNEKQWKVPMRIENQILFVCVPIRGREFVLTEELFVLVKGNVILCEELTSVGQVKCAVILAWTFFWRSVLTSNMASILRKNKERITNTQESLKRAEQNSSFSPTGSLMSWVLFELLPFFEECLVEVNVSVPDVLL